ncbi:MAG: hypothetical protein JSU94_12605 [Phycisphaerales bacterium]|nr:MAG: hypothetical protein JSU94_12605 [Phycisphaerales bacterium]
MSKDSTMGLSPERIARLLGVSIGRDGEKDKAEGACGSFELMWSGWREALGLDGASDKSGGSLEKVNLGAGASRDREALLGVLTDSQSDLGTIKRIRRYAKDVASRAGEPERTLAFAVYFGAIANALVFHEVKITTYSYESLCVSYEKLLNRPCVPEELFGLFGKARDLCRRRSR